MRIIDIDVSRFSAIDDFYSALLRAVGAPEWHGCSVDALIDSMIWGGINSVEPPYTVRFSGTAQAPKEIRDKIALVQHFLAKARAEFRADKGHDVEVQLEIGD